VLGESALLSYLCTAVYRSQFDAVIAWDDPDIAIRWPLESGRLSPKDASAPRLTEIAAEALPRMKPCKSS
jgi:dTDP-4-dehydrorhamnose 3,5-epimerase